MKAIVTGVSGQDGYYMTQLLTGQGIAVLGLTTDVSRAEQEYAANRPAALHFQSFDYSRQGAFSEVVNFFEPDLIFNFAAKATGVGMFDAPFEMNRLNGTFVVDILEAIRGSEHRETIAFCQASSSEMFGNASEKPQRETTCFHPKSPYGAAKLYAHNMVNIYRTAYGMRCSSAILYNHESTRRSAAFVTKKIAIGAARIKRNLVDHLSLGYLGISRDWGYAPEYMEALLRIATAPKAADYVVATGRLTTIETLCEVAFGHLGLDYRKFVRSTPAEIRAIESVDLCGDPAKIQEDLGWRSERTVKEIMVEMVDHEMTRLEHCN